MSVEGGAMRTCLPALVIALACAAPAVGATRTFEVTGFEKIQVKGPFKVVLTTGVPPSAKASGAQGALDRVAIDMVGRTLVVHTNQSAWGSSSNSDDSGAIEVRIGTHELNSATLMGAGSLQISDVHGLSFDESVQGSGQIVIGRADVDQFTATLIGTASAVVSGRAGMLKLSTEGVSSFDGSGLVAKDATIRANGASTIKAGVTNSAKIDATGPATVSLSGGASCTTRLTGSASASGCRVRQ